jgi:hypothetical protein
VWKPLAKPVGALPTQRAFRPSRGREAAVCTGCSRLKAVAVVVLRDFPTPGPPETYLWWIPLRGHMGSRFFSDTQLRFPFTGCTAFYLAAAFLTALTGLAAAQVPTVSGPPTVIDWTKGPKQSTKAVCGPLSFSGMTDGGTYYLYVDNEAPGTCSFSNSDAPTLTFLLPPNFGATTSGTPTVFRFVRHGTDVDVLWLWHRGRVPKGPANGSPSEPISNGQL